MKIEAEQMDVQMVLYNEQCPAMSWDMLLKPFLQAPIVTLSLSWLHAGNSSYSLDYVDKGRQRLVSPVSNHYPVDQLHEPAMILALVAELLGSRST